MTQRRPGLAATVRASAAGSTSGMPKSASALSTISSKAACSGGSAHVRRIARPVGGAAHRMHETVVADDLHAWLELFDQAAVLF